MKTTGQVLVAVAAVVIFAATLSAQAPPESLTPAQRIDKIFERWDRPGTPGCAVGVAQRGQVVYAQGYGMANLEYGVRNRPDTIFESGSVAKQFTAGAIVLLAQDGKLSLDDPVRKYVPELPDFGTPILIRHFLTHTSGIRSQWPLMMLSGRPPGQAVHTVDEILEQVSFQKELNFKPGDEYLYNNTAFTLLGVIVQRVSGQSLDAFSQERLFKPLGMTRTSWRADFSKIVEGRATAYRLAPDGTFRTNMSFTNVIGNGGLLTTVGDLLIWNENLDNPKVGGRAWAGELQTQARLNDGSPIEYARGLFVDTYRGVREVSHGGSTAGYQTFLGRFPDERLSVAVLCNTTGTNPGGYAHQVADIFLKDKLKPVPAIAAVEAPGGVLARLAGLYRDRSTDALVRLSWDADRKLLRAGGQPLVPTGAGVLSSADGSRTITLEGAGLEGGWPVAGPPARLSDRSGSGRPRVWHYEKSWAPTPAQLAEFAGDYVSDELGLVYTFYVEGDRLKLRFRPAQRSTLIPAFTDGFEENGSVIRFTRSDAGAIDGLRIYAGRVRHLRFVRR